MSYRWIKCPHCSDEFKWSYDDPKFKVSRNKVTNAEMSLKEKRKIYRQRHLDKLVTKMSKESNSLPMLIGSDQANLIISNIPDVNTFYDQSLPINVDNHL